MRSARSNATQAITFEWVKCRSGPRTSQMPASVLRQPSSSHSSVSSSTAHACSSGGAPAARARTIASITSP